MEPGDPSPRLRLVASLDHNDGVGSGDIDSSTGAGAGGDEAESSLEEKVERLVREADVVVFGRTWCPYFKNAAELLTESLCVHTHVVETNVIPRGAEVVKYLKEKTEHPWSSPFIFVRGKFLGGCEELFDLYQIGELERETLRGLINRQRTLQTDQIETARLAPPYRGCAVLPLFLHPYAVNNHVTRVTALFIFALCIVGASFHSQDWAPYVAASICIDSLARFVAGPSLSAAGMISTLLTIPGSPNYLPGPSKQLDAFLSMCIAAFATVFFFVEFEGNDILGCIALVVLACVTAIEGFFDLTLGDTLIEYGIHLSLFPGYINRIYNSTLLETVETFNYNAHRSNAQKPIRINTDRNNPIALRYKKKSEEWRKDDFDPIRHMHIQYLYCPLSIACLAVTFRVSSEYRTFDGYVEPRNAIVKHFWFQVISPIAAFIFVFMLFMYLTKALLFGRKVRKEFNDPHACSGFACIGIALMLFGFLCYDQIFTISEDEVKDSPAQVLGRVFFWLGSVPHALFTIKVVGDWIGRRLELEHVQAHWMIFPTGLGIAGFVAPVVGPFAEESAAANELIARFYTSFGLLMWIVLFVVTFIKVVTGHNSDSTLRHGIWFWIANPAALGLASISICMAGESETFEKCAFAIDLYLFISVFLFFVLIWASTSRIGFLGILEFNMAYWIDCFALSMLASCAAMFYLITGLTVAAALEFFFLVIASLANLIALLHTLTNLIRKHNVATPEARLDPLTFVRLTHDAVRANLPTVQYYLHTVDLDSDTDEARDNLGLFAAHFNRFFIVQDEHLIHEDRVIYRTCTDYFPGHGKKFTLDHRDDHVLLIDWRELVDTVLDIRALLSERKEALERLRSELPPFFSHLIRHFRGEEENLDPIAKKYLPLELKKQLARYIWRSTPAEKWEIIIPFVLINLPRQEQRVRFLRSLLWTIPERAQQIGAIVYRNVDAVMWERLRVEVREMIPRGAPQWIRHY